MVWINHETTKKRRKESSEDAHLTWPVCGGDSCREESRLAGHSEDLAAHEALRRRNSMTSATRQETLKTLCKGDDSYSDPAVVGRG
jgi:hypothetical protein